MRNFAWTFISPSVFVPSVKRSRCLFPQNWGWGAQLWHNEYCKNTVIVDLQLQCGALFCVNYRNDLGVFFILFIDTKNHSRTTENDDTWASYVDLQIQGHALSCETIHIYFQLLILLPAEVISCSQEFYIYWCSLLENYEKCYISLEPPDSITAHLYVCGKSLKVRDLCYI